MNCMACPITCHEKKTVIFLSLVCAQSEFFTTRGIITITRHIQHHNHHQRHHHNHTYIQHHNHDQRHHHNHTHIQTPQSSPPIGANNLVHFSILCVSSLHRGHANLLCIVPTVSDDPRRESNSCLQNKGNGEVGKHMVHACIFLTN